MAAERSAAARPWPGTRRVISYAFPEKTDAASRSCERERGIPIFTAPDETPAGADNPEPPAESAGPPGPRGLGCQYGGPAARFDTQNREKFLSAIAGRIRPAAPAPASRRQKPNQTKPQIVIHPVSTSVPSAVWQRNRNGLSGMGSTEKQPISSTSVVVISPALV